MPFVTGRLLLDEPGHRHRGRGAAVEAAGEADDVAAAGRGLAQLDRRLDGVRAGGAAEVDLHPVPQGGRQHGELGGDEVVLRGGGQVQAVGEDLQLAGGDAHELGVVVPEGEHPGAGQEVDEDVAVDVAHQRATRRPRRRWAGGVGRCARWTRAAPDARAGRASGDRGGPRRPPGR